MQKLFLTFIILLSCVTAFAQTKTDPKIVSKLDKRRIDLEKRIAKEVDPEKRKELIRMDYQTQDYYLRNDVKLEMLRQNFPEYAKQVEYYQSLPKEVKEKRLEEAEKYQMSRSSEVFGDFETTWDSLTDDQKSKVCSDSVGLCLEKSQIGKCKFVLMRCKFIIKENIYKKVREFVKKKAEEKKTPVKTK
jgi:hypothetical protein